MKKKPGLAVDEYAGVGAACGRCGGGRRFWSVLPWALLGLSLGWPFLGSRRVDRDLPTARNPAVTFENFVAIQPGMASFDVVNLLGSGELAAEEGYLVDASGRYRRWVIEDHRREEAEGALGDHHGQPIEQVRKVVRYGDGRRRIFVTFLNGEVVEKAEENLR